MGQAEFLWPGENAVIPVDDRGLTYGDGLFETLRVTGHGPVLLEAHRDRLLAACRALAIPFDQSLFEHWREEASRRGLLNAQGDEHQVLRLMVTRGSGGRGYRPPTDVVPRVITVLSSAPPLPKAPVSAVTLEQPMTVPPHRQGIKTLERLDQVQASLELPSDVFEGLMADQSGELLEGTRTNLILVKGHRIVTPVRSRLAVAGTLRDSLIRDLPGRGYQVEEAPISRAQLMEGGLMLVNSVIGAAIVGVLDGQPLPFVGEAEAMQEWIVNEYGY